MGLWVYHGGPNGQFLSSWEIQPGDRMTLRCLWGIQLETSRRQFREESGLEKVLKSFSQLPWTYISESIQSWRNHQEFSSRLRPCISHDTQSKPPQYPVSLCRALLQGEHGRGSSLGDGYLPQWTGAPASWLPANGVSHDCSHLIRDSCSRHNWAETQAIESGPGRVILCILWCRWDRSSALPHLYPHSALLSLYILFPECTSPESPMC